MDLLNVLRTLRQFKWTTLTIVGLTVGAIAILVFAVPKVYQVDAAYVLVNPSVPSDQELQTRPDLAAENRNNPYLRFANQSMVGQVIATRMSSDEVRNDLLGQGISDDYVVAPSNDFGGAGQIVTVSGVGPTPEAASHATEAIVARMGQELRSMQQVYGAADRYLITQIPVQAPGEAKRVVSGQLRSVIAVGGAGLVILFAAISIRQAMDARPKGPAKAGAAPPHPAPTTDHLSAAADLPAVAAPVVAPPLTGPPPPPVAAPVPAPVPAVVNGAANNGAATNGAATNGAAAHGPGTNGANGTPARATTMRLARNGSRALALADDLDAVSSFRQRDGAPLNEPLPQPDTGPPQEHSAP